MNGEYEKLLEQKTKNLTIAWLSDQQPLFVNSETITVAMWLADVRNAQQYYQAQAGKTGMLFDSNLYRFSVMLMGLLSAGKDVILPPNAQPDTLESVRAYSDFICSMPSRTHYTSAYHNDTAQVSFPAQANITFFTSGSSGEPKVIRKHVAQLLLEADTLEQTFGAKIPSTALVAATVPVNHIYGFLFRLLWPLTSGRSIYLPTIDYSEMLQHIPLPYFLVSSPAHLSRFDDYAALPSKPLHISSSGGPLSPATAARIDKELGYEPIEVYGSTETGGVAWREGQKHSHPWQLFSGIKMRSNDEHCLVVLSPYVSDSEWLETQDRVEIIDPQRFYLRGRADRIVKLAEKRVSLPEMEAYCLKHPYVEEARCLLVNSKRPSLGAVLVLNQRGVSMLQQQGKHALNQSLRSHLATRFDRVVVPRKFRYMSELPSNDRGKVSEQQVKELFE